MNITIFFPGGWLLQAGANYQDDDFTIGDLLTRIIGASIASASFAGDRIRAMNTDKVECGVQEYK